MSAYVNVIAQHGALLDDVTLQKKLNPIQLFLNSRLHRFSRALYGAGSWYLRAKRHQADIKEPEPTAVPPHVAFCWAKK